MIANSIYHGLQLTAEKKYPMDCNYWQRYLVKSIDNASAADTNVSWAGSFDSLQDPTSRNWTSLSTSTFPIVIQFSYSYDLPVGHGRAFLGNMPRWADLIIGGWKTNGIWRISDGRPLAFFLNDGGQPLPTYGSQRPNIVEHPSVTTGFRLGGQLLCG